MSPLQITLTHSCTATFKPHTNNKARVIRDDWGHIRLCANTILYFTNVTDRRGRHFLHDTSHHSWSLLSDCCFCPHAAVTERHKASCESVCCLLLSSSTLLTFCSFVSENDTVRAESEAGQTETSEVENQTWSLSLRVRSSFSIPCTVHYVTTDCLHTQLWWGTRAKFTEVTQSTAKHNCLSGGKITGDTHRTIWTKRNE